ncbi:transcriptional regulatory protein pro-1 [Zymoseptoria brevis]|uniref:Transcriptional regulatory protein pro-1 n=1 Tax=Zymoseptoria brevis TaxID=1047168 RepID=A0A0F4GE03_9PEZI|nr:transcriptional regulatory protein pro-1 [Zymoseptoria brevis]
MAATKNAASEAKAAAAKMHRRSRSGCFTCRLRRKKCEEGKPACKACTHLGLRCDYKRPLWWSNGEQRRNQKEHIKNVIKKTQLSKKTPQQQQQQSHQQSQHQRHLSTSSPPPLTHSVPNSAEAPFAEAFPPSQCPSEGSPYSVDYDLTYTTDNGYFSMPPPPQPYITHHSQYPMFSPYEVDIKTEREVFVNNIPTRRDSTISTFSTFQPPPTSDGLPAYPADSWIQQEHFESTSEEFAEEAVDFNFFEFPHGPLTPNHETVINVEEGDKYLLNHFFDKVLKLIFPILNANQHGSAREDVILPALESNRAYLHCCLSIAATHMKDTETSFSSSPANNEQLDNDVVRHRYAAVSELCEALGADTNHAQILEATLGMIFFQCSVGRADDALPDIPWHQHFSAATSLVNRLDLPTSVLLPQEQHHQASFNMTLTSWIDILGSTILGRQPTFADTYREMNMSNGSLGLAELMGCDDKIMFLIAEIACLDVQRGFGLDEVMLCKYVETLANAIGETELNSAGVVQSCFSTTGAIRPKQLTTNITAVFRVAARIYLCTLVPGYSPTQPSMCHLISRFSELMNFIPAGTEGFDRSLAWPLLIAGASSTRGSPFRGMLEERSERLGDAAAFGSFGRIRELLNDVWAVNDDLLESGVSAPVVGWREVMAGKGWEFLLI